jgi:branched-chain amino acid transport system ATP-binding protein
VSALLEVAGLHKRFGAVVACEEVHLLVETGEVHAVIGPNGAGKTTLIAQLAGELRPDAGRITFDGADLTFRPANARAHVGLARSFQIASLFEAFTVQENAALAVQATQGHSFRFRRPAAQEAGLQDRAREVLARVDLTERAREPVASLAHGEKRQLELAMALACRPRLLLLDEPLAGLGAEESARMVERLAQLRAEHTILLIEHDMDAVFALADRISVMVQGRVVASGRPEAIRADPAVRAAYLGEDGDARA